MKIDFNKFLFKHKSKLNKFFLNRNHKNTLNNRVYYLFSCEWWFLKEKDLIISRKSRTIEKRDDLRFDEELQKIIDKVFDE